jgi:uncharacterized protein with gpF-like domain
VRKKPYSFTVRPNAGIQAAYQRALDAEIRAMHKDVLARLKTLYAAQRPRIAQDASPAEALQAEITALGRQWLNRFEHLAPWLARHFATKAADRSDRAMMGALRRGGFSVRMQMTPAQTDALDAIVAENVALIRSIPAQYFTQIEGMVMRSVTTGRDLKTLTDDLVRQYGVTRRRAAFISLDQNNKATASMVAIRQKSLGLKATWLHSAGGKVPRPTHVANSGKEYDPIKGWWDPAVKRFIWPGTEPACRCVSRTVVPGLT